ncbi:hypothetical protein U9M48_004273 [Paspalum notatum var. saurae]|uniref:Uncharacterized protein n=1 Tax=Paspalum notatum var. saurae TaxID=547442 RepID=A0AAQ3PSX6_PASNO
MFYSLNSTSLSKGPTPEFKYPANEELPPDQPLIEEPEDEPEDPHATADHTAAEAPSNPSGEGVD